MKTTPPWLALVLLASTTTACVDRFETESAYASERYLCDPSKAAAFDEMIELCRAEWLASNTCGGVLSFTGTLEGKPLTVESDLGQTAFNFLDAVAPARRLDRIEVYGASPYFFFGFDFRSVGLDLAAGAPERTFSIDTTAEEIPGGRDDDALSLGLRISVGGESIAHVAATGSGAVVLTPISEREVAGRFNAELAAGDRMEGCFHGFATRQVVIRSGP